MNERERQELTKQRTIYEGPDRRLLLNYLSEDLSKYLGANNPRFDRARFLAACRGEDSKDSAGRTVKYGR